MPVMLPGSYAAINLETVIATLEGFSKRGFSGDVSFTYKNRQPLREVNEVHHPETLPPADFIVIVRQHFDAISNWLSLPDTVLLVRFNAGRITKIVTRDQTPKAEA